MVMQRRKSAPWAWGRLGVHPPLTAAGGPHSPAALAVRRPKRHVPLEGTEAQEGPKLHPNQRTMGLLCYTYNGVCYFFSTLFVAALGLGCRERYFSVVISGGYSLVVVHRLLIAVASLVVEKGSRVQTPDCRLQSADSVVVAHGLSCSVACGIFLDQGSNRVSCIGRRILNHWTTREAKCLSCEELLIY